MADTFLQEYDQFALLAGSLLAVVKENIKFFPFETGRDVDRRLRELADARSRLLTGLPTSTSEWARMLGVSIRTVERMVDRNEIAAVNKKRSGIPTRKDARQGKLLVGRVVCLPLAHAQLLAETSQELKCSERTEAR